MTLKIGTRGRVALLLAAAALVYASTLWNGFVQDDPFFIVENPRITTEPWRLLYEPHPGSNLWRPVVFVSYWMSYALGDRKSTRLNSSHIQKSRMPSSA